jgi:hypothetical protein
MLQVDEIYAQLFLPGKTPIAEFISDYEALRYYNYENDEFMIVETDRAYGKFAKNFEKAKAYCPDATCEYETYEVDGNIIYVGKFGKSNIDVETNKGGE